MRRAPAIAAVGSTMQFDVTDVLNLADGAAMIASAFVAYALNQGGVNVWIGMLAVAAAGAAGSVLLNKGIYTPFQRRGSAPTTLVIISLGTTLIIEFGLQAIVCGTTCRKHEPGTDGQGGRPDPHRGSAGDYRAVHRGDGRRPRAASLQQTRQGDARRN